MKTKYLLLLFLLAAMFLPMAVNAQETFTVYNSGTTTNATIPFSGANAKYQQRNQMIYYADLLSSISGKDLTAMTFYISGSPTGDLGNWVVSLAETTAANFNSGASFNTTPLTQVYSGPMVFNSNRTQMTVYFDQSFHYNGGNLLVQFSNPDPVNSQTANSAYNFYSSAQLTTSQKQSYAYKNFSSGAVVNEQKRYLPRVTFTYDSENTNPKPTDLTVNHTDGASTAELSWTSTASAWNVDVNGTVTTVTSNQFTLTGLVMETPCVIKVQADFGGGETSDWATMAFTPTNITMVGSGTATNNCFPTYGGDKYSLTEQIFTPEELGGPGLITGLDFYNTTSGATTRKLLIYMLYTEKDCFESGTDWVQVTSSDLVYTGASNATILSTNGWSHINLTTPFDYDGGSNVLIVIDDNSGNYTDGAKNFRSYTTPQYQAIYQHNDNTNLNPTVVTPTGATSIANPDNPGTRSTSKSQIRFHKGNAPTCPKPIHLAVNYANGANSAQVSWESNAESFNIDVNGTVTNGVTMPYTLTDLVMETAYTIKVQGVCNGEAGDWSRPYVFTPTNLVIIGEDTGSSNVLPTNTNYKYSLTQQILTPEELGASNIIKGIDFYNTSATVTRKIQIYMVAVDKNSFSDGYDWVKVASGNSVFSNANVTFVQNDWTYIQFTTPFNYDGESNVLLVIDDNTNADPGFSYFKSFTCSEIQSFYISNDATNYSATVNPGSSTAPDNGSVSSTKNYMRIHKGNNPSCPKPVNLAVSHENGATTAQVNCESDAELFNIDIKVGTSASTITYGVTLPYTLENLVMETNYTIKVQADCGGGDVSDWSNAYTFTPTNLAIVGEGSGINSYLPTNVNYNYSLTQQIFTAEELGGPAPIKGIEVYNNSATDVTRTIQIYMVATDKESFESVDDRVVVASGNRVFGAANNGTAVTFAANSWTYIPFSTAFDYDGGNNVLLAIDDNSGSYVDPINFLSFTTTDDQAIYFYSDNENPVPTTSVADFDPSLYTNGVTNSKNQVRFHKGNPPTCPRPVRLAVNYSGGRTAEVTWECDADVNVMLNNSTVATGISGNSYTLTNLALNTNYTVKVQADCGGGDLSEWTNSITFKTDQYESMCDLYYSLTDSYGDGWNGAKLLVKSGSTTLATLTNQDLDGEQGEETQTGILRYQDGKALSFVWNTGQYDGECSFVITDAWGQVLCELEVGSEPANNEVLGTYAMNCNEVTYTLDIEGYGDGDGGWYLIASPVDFALVENVDGCIDDENEEDYDLYYFDQTQELEWRNYKAEPFHLESGKGYLYANKHDVTLTFTGLAIESDGDVALTYSDANSDAIMQGLNLVGNPFTVPAWPSLDWYWMNDEGTEIIYSDWTDPVAPMQGIFVYTTTNTEMTFYPVRSKGENCTVAGLSLNLSHASTGSTPLGIIDRAMVRFGEGSPLPKFQLNPNHTKIYIPQSGKDYAMVHSEGMGELPVCFKAERNGSYTLSVNDHEVTFGYLHLIDNMTGADIDLLRTPSYSFEAHTTDYAYRFKLVFICDDANVDDESFAFFSNGSFLISNNGEATLQVIDVMGRIMSSESFSGNTSVNIDAAPGVYVLRLISGENVRTQKVVVR